ncbi:MAG: hypothetical protein ACJAX5_001654, partial [Patiriisocius sp.]
VVVVQCESVGAFYRPHSLDADVCLKGVEWVATHWVV